MPFLNISARYLESDLYKILPMEKHRFALQSLLSPAQVITEDIRSFGHDRMPRYISASNPMMVVLPQSTEEVQSILQYCTKHQLPLVPSGGRTGLSGGAVAAKGEIVLSLSKMNRIVDIDPVNQSVTCEAGVIQENLDQALEPYGATLPYTLGSKGSCQIGGNVSTNVGGLKYSEYGPLRNYVLGLEVVLGNGTVLDLNHKVHKNNAGVDLKQLFIGAEGILGIITQITLKYVNNDPHFHLFMLGTHSMDQAVESVLTLKRRRFTLKAVEFLSRNCLESVVGNIPSMKDPFLTPHNFYLLFQINARQHEEISVFDVCNDLLEQNLAQDCVFAQSTMERRLLWDLRENISESLNQRGAVHRNDLALPLSQLSDFVKALDTLIQKEYSPFQVYRYGHLGDGNIHLNILAPSNYAQERFEKRCDVLDERLFQLVHEFGGAISAEHGIGLLRKPYVSLTKSPEELSLLQQLKTIFDPHGILNPGKVI